MALGAIALATIGKVRGVPSAVTPFVPLTYTTSCAFVETSSVDGVVSNSSLDSYRVRGEVRFVFAMGTPLSRPDLLVRADIQVPPGGTVRAARARLDPPLRPGETCAFDVAASIQRGP